MLEPGGHPCQPARHVDAVLPQQAKPQNFDVGLPVASSSVYCRQ